MKVEAWGNAAKAALHLVRPSPCHVSDLPQDLLRRRPNDRDLRHIDSAVCGRPPSEPLHPRPEGLVERPVADLEGLRELAHERGGFWCERVSLHDLLGRRRELYSLGRLKPGHTGRPEGLRAGCFHHRPAAESE